MGTRTPTAVNMRAVLFASAILLFLCTHGCATTTLPQAAQGKHESEPQRWLSTTVCFASAQDAIQLLGAEDEYTRRMSPLDRSLRVRTPMPVGTQEHLHHASQAAVNWTTHEIAQWSPAIQLIAEALHGLKIPLPDQIVLIRTNGDDELKANYTRSHGIILPRVPSSPTQTVQMVSLLAHELFHIASRVGPTDFRDRMYELAGFHRVSPGPMPAAFESRRLTNPDAYTHHHALQVLSKSQGQVLVIPVLSSRLSRKELTRNTTLQRAVDLRLAPLSAAGTFQIRGKQLMTMPVSDTDYAVIASLNTRYIIHPEEILADNFALLIQHRAGYQTTIDHPEILERLLIILRHRNSS